jgi:VIT1/CCC1 family predicted Fe2+/Mn2+ transporter
LYVRLSSLPVAITGQPGKADVPGFGTISKHHRSGKQRAAASTTQRLLDKSTIQRDEMTPSPEPEPEFPAEHGHSPEEIQQRLAAPKGHSYLRDFVYGAIDGTVTTFAVVSGVAGAELDSSIVIILGAANLVGDGFSMAAGNYLGTRAEQQERERVRQMEESHIEHFPEGEREEIRQLFAAKGFEGDDLERAVNVITSDRRQWVDTMLTDEHGLTLNGPNPLKAAAATLVAFLLPFITQYVNGSPPAPYAVSTILTGVAFFLIGTAKSRFVEQSWILAGLESLLIGGSAAVLAYFVGAMLKGLGV